MDTYHRIAHESAGHVAIIDGRSLDAKCLMIHVGMSYEDCEGDYSKVYF